MPMTAILATAAERASLWGLISMRCRRWSTNGSLPKRAVILLRNDVDHAHRGGIDQYDLIVHLGVLDGLGGRHSRKRAIRQDIEFKLRGHRSADRGGEVCGRCHLLAVLPNG